MSGERAERPKFFCVLVCGGRDYADREHLFAAMDALDAERPITKLVTGGAAGADHLAGLWANTKLIPTTIYCAEWERYGRAAGPRRNAYMLRDATPDLVVAFPGGRGTANMVGLAEAACVPVRLLANPPTQEPGVTG